jgi:hypothetical protein
MKKALVTLTIGSAYREMGEITHPLMRDYARRCGVDFLVLRQPRVNSRYGLSTRYEKFQLFELLQHYDQIAFVDTDVLIAPDAPSLFKLVPRDRFAAANESIYSQADRDKTLTQEILGPVEWRSPYFNSGVMVFGRAHSAVFDPAAPELLLWSRGDFRKRVVNLLNDQPYLNHRLNRLDIPLLDLGHRFNHTRCITATQTRFRSHFIHYSGPSGHRYGSRLEQLRKDATVLQSPVRLWLSRRSNTYRWVTDRTDAAFVGYLLQSRVRKTFSAGRDLQPGME